MTGELPATGDDRYVMMACEQTVDCRVNTFEHGPWGRCPSCNQRGVKLR